VALSATGRFLRTGDVYSIKSVEAASSIIYIHTFTNIYLIKTSFSYSLLNHCIHN
jgi:hypothetical protein